MVVKQKFYSADEYLSLEDRAETRSEYIEGAIVGVAGASTNNNTLIYHLIGDMKVQTKNSGCRGFSNDQRVYIPDCSRYYYPELGVVCGKPDYDKRQGVQNLLNPTLIVEVLSQSTETQDRGDKSECY